MTAHIIWLEGRVDVSEVGARAASLATLRAAGVPVPRGFALGRKVHLRLTGNGIDRWLDAGKLPPDLHVEVSDALGSLGGSFAVRRSPLNGVREPTWPARGGRPERETYLHLTDISEVVEAVRRIWGTGGPTVPTRAPVAIIVQRFLLPDACAIVRCEGDRDILTVLASLGVGDLLAAGLVVPDRHTLRRVDGGVVTSALGRKAQMTIAREGGGVARVPVPAAAARRMALDEARLADLAALFRDAERALGPLDTLKAAWSAGRWCITSVDAPPAAAEDGLMLG
ncbi:MAG TPA: PEP/pyruvate-binding domain-containing protein [Haliangiales bacterium]|nr:PEP/pyruvate-binding domain-containing protein [Haliangiales bacterium]